MRITKPFYLGKYPVTQEQWEAVMGNNPSHFKGPKNPVEKVSWDDCQQFLEQAQRESRAHCGRGKFQLPTRGPVGIRLPGREHDAVLLRGRRGAAGRLCVVRQRTRAARRIRWARRSRTPGGCTTCTATCGSGVQDWYDDGYYAKSPTDDPPGAASGTYRVLRGGGWIVPAWHCRSAYRSHDKPDTSYPVVGVRAAMALAEKP